MLSASFLSATDTQTSYLRKKRKGENTDGKRRLKEEKKKEKQNNNFLQPLALRKTG